MKREELIAYACSFVSFLLQSDVAKDITRIILFGSIARGDFSKDSDIDLFIDTSKNIEKRAELALSSFLKSETQKKWKLKGLKHELSLKIGDLTSWGSLKRSVISDGILLYGKYKDFPDKIDQYSLLELSFKKHNRRKKVSLWRNLYGYKQKVGKKVYTSKGKIEELGGKRIETGVIVPVNNIRQLIEFLNREKIGYTIREVWSDSV